MMIIRTCILNCKGRKRMQNFGAETSLKLINSYTEVDIEDNIKMDPKGGVWIVHAFALIVLNLWVVLLVVTVCTAYVYLHVLLVQMSLAFSQMRWQFQESQCSYLWGLWMTWSKAMWTDSSPLAPTSTGVVVMKTAACKCDVSISEVGSYEFTEVSIGLIVSAWTRQVDISCVYLSSSKYTAIFTFRNRIQVPDRHQRWGKIKARGEACIASGWPWTQGKEVE